MISVLRLGHRMVRDKRISTHVGLTSRALGADEIIYTGDHDTKLLKSIKNVVEEWGGDFKIKYFEDYMKLIKDYKNKGYIIIHLTMYGLRLQKVVKDLKKHKNILLIIGGCKVPGEIYEIADYNISVTNQPHSEISALAITLHELLNGEELNKTYENASMGIKPSNKGKEFL